MTPLEIRAAIAAQNDLLSPADANGYSSTNRAVWNAPDEAVSDAEVLAEAALAAGIDLPGRVPGSPLPDYSQGARGGLTGPTYRDQLERADKEGRTIDYLALVNKPLNESRRLGITVEQWHQRGYGSYDSGFGA